MPIYTESKDALSLSGTSPTGSQREPLVTPEKLRNLHLFGISLVSKMKDPVTGKRVAMTDPLLKEFIQRAVSIVEDETRISITPVQLTEKYPYDHALYRQYGYMMLNHRPVASIDALTITPANGIQIYNMPLEWVEVANLERGQLNLVPLGIAINSGGNIPVAATGGAPFVNILGYDAWMPAFWQVKYTIGFKDQMVPRIINELIGTVAAIEILQQLAATNSEASSWSLGIDGLSQSVSGPGGDLFTQRITQLQEKRDKLIGKCKATYGTKLFASSI